MDEKRFTFADGFKIVAIRDNGKIMNSKQVCNKLNELHEENHFLRQEIADYHNSNGELHRKVGRLIRRLSEFHISYDDIL